ncbi:hypothetical protein [Kistimonas asteriae]|uniref:hypothetical protein n=1 Tax=Kistimonas asteriae TaxID=517724 RepID=UPI001BA9DDEF|nr:hypothetical protein [Kistimonas asteriae]
MKYLTLFFLAALTIGCTSEVDNGFKFIVTGSLSKSLTQDEINVLNNCVAPKVKNFEELIKKNANINQQSASVHTVEVVSYFDSSFNYTADIVIKLLYTAKTYKGDEERETKSGKIYCDFEAAGLSQKS